MRGNRLAPEPELSDVVRDRLAALLADVPARRAMAPAPDPVDEKEPWADQRQAAGTTTQRAQAAGEPQPMPEAAPLLVRARRAAWEFTRGHLLAVGIVLLTGCLWAGYNVLQARSSPVSPMPVMTPTVAHSPSPTPSPATVLVHVLGAVAKPGVVTLSDGARVLDAVVAAGGLTADADPGELNLAAVVADGSQVVIGDRRKPRGEVRSAAVEAGTTEMGAAKLNLNTASQAQLETLPGVGPVTAQKILAWREQHGSFTKVDELQEVAGIGPKTYAELAPQVTV